MHAHHYALEPFFRDNDALLMFFEEALSTCEDSERHEIEPHYEKVKATVEACSPGVGTVFECQPTLTSNWSKRLTAGLRHLFAPLDIEYSADMGLHFSQLVSVSLRAPFDKRCFLFHGAPDILIHQSKKLCFQQPAPALLLKKVRMRLLRIRISALF